MGGHLQLLVLLLIQIRNYTNADSVGTCPKENKAYVTFLTDSEDCSIFYKCSWGVAYKFDCPGGLYFNPEISVCDWPDQVDCGNTVGGNDDGDVGDDNVDNGNTGNKGTDRSEETEGGKDGADGDDGEDNGSDDNTSSGDNGVTGECPLEDGEYAVHFSHESDCTKFYKCDRGTPVLQECPNGLHFNPTLSVCDYPESAGCDSSAGGNGNENDDNDDENDTGDSGADNSEETEDGNDGDDGHDNGSDDNTSGGYNGATVECPLENGEYADHFPHESDCSKFYKCDSGTPVLQECPNGLHFNPTLSVCDYPESAGCDSSVGGNGNDNDGNDDENDTGDSGADNSEETEGGNDGDDGQDNGSDDNTNGGDNDETGKCPLEDGEYAVHFPHESDCTKFYKCDRGTKVLQECPNGLHYNPTLSVCDYPESAGCDNVGGNGNENDDNVDGNDNGDSGADNSEETEGGNDGDHDQDNGSDDNTSGVDNGAAGECPLEDGEYAVHFPHESDCTKFYKCDRGTPVLQECPNSLHFNPTLSVCDYPESAGCDSSAGGNGNDNDGNDDENDTGDSGADYSEETEGGNDGDDGQDKGSDDNTSGGENGATGECPLEDEEYAVHFPHESDCTKFYKCDRGTPVLQECPNGLHFNPTLSVCDYPESAGCDSSVGGNANDDNEDENDTGDSGTDNSEETKSGYDGDDGADKDSDDNTSGGGNGAISECPLEDGEYAVHFPHESDCTKFYKCDRGTPVLQECPNGLHFNPTLSVCDYPESAGCDSSAGGNENDDDGNVDENDTGDSGADNSEETEGGNDGVDGQSNGSDDNTNGGNNGATGECPLEDGEYAVHFPHESDCTKFYKCNRGTPVLQECPNGLHYNPTLSVCDYPESAGCDIAGGNGNENDDNVDENDTGDSGADNSEETESGNDADDGQDNGSDDNTSGGDNGATGECPLEDGEYAVHFPHESDCTKFYKCDRGTPVLQECPNGLHFNPTLSVCDYPESAGCDSSAGGNGNDNDGNDDKNDTGDSGADYSEETEGGNDGDDGQDKGSDDNTSGGENGATGECPLEDGEYAVHFPHESDCTKFYKCDRGTPVLQECPNGLHFNPTLSVCDYPESAGCDSSVGGNANDDNEDENDTGDSGTDNSEETESGYDGDDGPDKDSDDNTSGGVNGAISECPLEDGEYAVHFSHESDCTKFYKCDRGTPVLQECLNGLYFNPTLSVCDYPESAGCDSSAGGNENDVDGNVDENDTGDSGADNSEETEGGNDGDDGQSNGRDDNTNGGNNGATGECPLEDGEYAVHFPHESDCTKFYKCNRGTPVLQECPNGLHYNPTLSVCDYPESAGCDSAGGNGNENDDNVDENDTGDSGADFSEETESGNDADDGQGKGSDDNTSGGDNSATGECPLEDGEYAVHFPHESDCTNFYKCDRGTPVLQECPNGLHFNPTLSVCDYPDGAGCDSSSGDNGNDNDDNDDEGDSGDSDTYNSEETDGDNDGSDNIIGDDNAAEDGSNGKGNDDSNGLGICASVNCPANNEAYVTFVANNNDCRRFCKCNWGVAYEFYCSGGLYFNPTLNVCDWPQNSGCTM